MKRFIILFCICWLFNLSGCKTLPNTDSTVSIPILNFDLYSAVFMNYFFNDFEKFEYFDIADEKKREQIHLRDLNSPTLYFWSEGILSNSHMDGATFINSLDGTNQNYLLYSNVGVPRIFNDQKIIFWWSWNKPDPRYGYNTILHGVAVKK